MKPTRILSLVAIAMATAAAAWGALRIGESSGHTLPGVPWSAPLALLGLTAILLAVTLTLRSRLLLQRRWARSGHGRSGNDHGRDGPPPAPLPMPVDPFFAARSVALAKACSYVGSVVAGLYAGYAIILLPDLDIPLRRDKALVCGACVLAAVVLVACALWLERICRLPGEPPEPSGL